MKLPDHATYEVKDGHLLVDGALIPLTRGAILLALVKSGWKGTEGLLSSDVADRVLVVDPRIGALSRRAG